jgi:hypothetical protein
MDARTVTTSLAAPFGPQLQRLGRAGSAAVRAGNGESRKERAEHQVRLAIPTHRRSAERGRSAQPSGGEPAPGTLGADLLPRARAWLDPYEDWVGPILFCWPIGGLFGMGWAFRRLAMRPRDTHLGDFKRRVFTAVCDQHFLGISYEPGEGIHWRIFDESGLFPFESDAYRSEDRFRGIALHSTRKVSLSKRTPSSGLL